MVDFLRQQPGSTAEQIATAVGCAAGYAKTTMGKLRHAGDVRTEHRKGQAYHYLVLGRW
jgi:hypothetical protein